MSRSTARVHVTLLTLLGTVGAACKSDPEPAPKAAPPDAGPRTVELPAGACRLTSSSSLHGVPLHLDADSAPYAEAGTNLVAMGAPPGARDDAPPPTFAVEVILPEGPAITFGLGYQTNELAVRGVVDPEHLEIHPARAAIAGGFLITTRVRIVRVAGAEAEIEPWLGTEIELIGAAPPTPIACTELSLDDPDDPRSLAPIVERADTWMALRSGDPIALAVAPDGPAVARLHPTGDRDLVEVLERRGGSTRIVRWQDGGIVFGWIPSSALTEPGDPRSLMGERGYRPPPALASLRCDRDVPLLVDVGGVRTIVGAVRAGATIAVVERGAATDRIEPAYPDVVPERDATFWVDHRALEGCSDVPPEPSDDDRLGRALQGLTAPPAAKRD